MLLKKPAAAVIRWQILKLCKPVLDNVLIL